MQEKRLEKGKYWESSDSFSARLDAILQEKGISQNELGRLMGTRQSTVRGWLTGATPRVATVTQLAELLNVNEVWLRTGVEHNPVAPPAALKVGERKNYDLEPDLSDDGYRDLIVQFIDEIPPRHLIEMVEGLGKRMASGDRSAVEKAGTILDLIHERRPEVFDDHTGYTLDYFGGVAAGQPSDIDYFSGETRIVPNDYGSQRHFLLRVRGESMEPDYPDGSFVVVRALQPGEYPKKGDIVIANDGDGPTMKLLEYRKTGEKSDTPRKPTPHLVSINPDCPEVIPMNVDTPIQGIVVDHYDPDAFEG